MALSEIGDLWFWGGIEPDNPMDLPKSGMPPQSEVLAGFFSF